jgi:HprK-related kinase A
VDDLDSLDWASQDLFDILGQRVLVRCTDAQFATTVRRLMRSFAPGPDDGREADTTLSMVMAAPSRDPTIRRFHFVYRGGSRVGRTTRQWEVFRFLECQLDFLLAEKVDWALLLHSGAVARGNAGVLLPGPSGSGKSSLSLALTQKGYSYFSDEIGVVEPDTGALLPFPKPVSIKNISIFPDLAQCPHLWLGPDDPEASGVSYLHPEDLVDSSMGRQAAIKHIIFPTYHAGQSSRLVPLDSGAALKELITNSINLPALGNRGFHRLASLARQARCFALESGDLAESVELINQLIESEA